MCWLIVFIVAIGHHLEWDHFSLFVPAMTLCNSNNYLQTYSLLYLIY